MVRLISVCVVGGLCVVTLLGSSAAQDPAGAGPAKRAGAATEPAPSGRQVRLDAVVTDRQGRPILDLEPTDFEVVENGVVQRIDAVELRASARAATALPVESGEDEERAARAPGTRFVGLILDEFHVSAGGASERVRDALTRFVDEQLRPNDLVAVLRPLDSVTAIRFTRDREGLRRAIAAFDGRKGDLAPRTDFEQKYLGSAPEAIASGRAQIVLAALRAMMMKLGDFEAGRSAIVLVTEGFAPPLRGRDQRVPDLQGLVRAASRFNVAVYTLSPAGSGGTPPADARSGLTALAVETGGEAVSGPADLLAGLGRISRDLDAYYLVSYTSSHPGDGRYYDVKVRTTRRDAQVRTRSGYWAPLRTELLSDRQERALAPVRALRRSPLIQTWVGLTVPPDGTPRVTLTWEPAVAARRGAPAAALVALKVTSPDGAVLFEGDVSAPRAPSRAGRPDAAVFPAAGGRIQVDLVIYGADGTRLDTASQDLDLPDATRADPVILPPQVLRASSAREFRELLADAQAAPAASRVFRRTERLLLRVPAYSSSGAPVEVAARLVNGRGQVLRMIERLPGGDPRLPQFDLPLAAFAAGEYSLEFVATTPAGAIREVVRIRLTG